MGSGSEVERELYGSEHNARLHAEAVERNPSRGRRPWDRLPAENDRQWAAFVLYRDLGELRALTTVSEETGYGYKRLQQIVAKYDWHHRVESFDSHLDRVRIAATKSEVHNMATRQAKLGRKLQDLADKRLDAYISSPELQSTLDANDITRLASEGVKIERLAEGAGDNDPDGGKPIVFKLNIVNGQLPRWAPAHVTDGNVTIDSKEDQADRHGDQVQEGTPPPADGGD